MLSFGKKLKELRKETNITQKDLSDFLNVTLGTIGMYETNRINPSPEILLKIADYFKISLDELFDRDFKN